LEDACRSCSLPLRRPPDDADALTASLQLLRVAEELMRGFDIHATGRFGLSRGRLGVLLWLERSERAGLRPAELAERLRVSRATVTTLLDGLERDGLLARGRVPGDRRGRRVTLTRAGRARAREIAPVHAARLAAVTRALDDDERAQLLALLGKLRGGLRALRSP
jgi:DNA-binding MarR family transcriptional regulator